MCPNSETGEVTSKKVHEKVQKRENNYVFTRNLEKETEVVDNDDLLLNDFEKLISSCKFPNALVFFKAHEHGKFNRISIVAKMFLGVQASEACVERMFSFAGHILANKRRKMGIQLFENLVFLKINENYL